MFFSDRPIEDIVLEARTDERTKVLEEFEKLINENRGLKNRCFAHTQGTICYACKMECENRSADFGDKS